MPPLLEKLGGGAITSLLLPLCMIVYKATLIAWLLGFEGKNVVSGQVPTPG